MNIIDIIYKRSNNGNYIACNLRPALRTYQLANMTLKDTKETRPFTLDGARGSIIVIISVVFIAGILIGAF